MGMFDQRDTRTKLILVHSDNTSVFANYLQMLISAKDDKEDEIVGVKDGTVMTTIWSEKDYLAQKPILSSMDHILFIGRGKNLSQETYGMVGIFDKFGMQYGWLGKHGYLRVTGRALKKEQLSNFFEFAKLYDPTIDENDVIKTNVHGNSANNKGVLDFVKKGVIVAAAGPLFGGALLINDKIKIKDRIRSCQYKTATIVFYRDGLAEFLKG